jgi:hypothetical protein
MSKMIVTYCCLDFRYGSVVNRLFSWRTNDKGDVVKWEIRGESPIETMEIEYCPWCALQVPVAQPK